MCVNLKQVILFSTVTYFTYLYIMQFLYINNLNWIGVINIFIIIINFHLKNSAFRKFFARIVQIYSKKLVLANIFIPS